MDRYLVRLKNDREYSPKDAHDLSAKIREVFGSRESIGNLRVSTRALEFDLFAKDKQELESKLNLLRHDFAGIETVKLLDKVPGELTKPEVLREGMDLFNQERYWEAHEILEQAWQPATGVERNTIQGLILTATALVHHQKDRDPVALGMLQRALSKLDEQEAYEGIDVGKLRREVGEILEKKAPRVLTLTRISHSGT